MTARPHQTSTTGESRPMNYNPYAAPQAAPPPLQGAPQFGGAPQPWEIGEVLGIGWDAFKANWAVLIFSYFLVGIISSVPVMLPGVLVATGTLEQGSTEYFATVLPCYFVMWVILMFFY